MVSVSLHKLVTNSGDVDVGLPKGLRHGISTIIEASLNITFSTCSSSCQNPLRDRLQDLQALCRKRSSSL